jgi:hypothetical protein
MSDEPQTVENGASTPRAASAAALTRATPSLVLVVVAGLAAVWATAAGSWTALAVVTVCIVDGLADGFFAWLRARASFAAGSATDSRDQVLVREFLRTYLMVVGAQAVVAYMVFAGLLLKPGGEAPESPGAPFITWQFWAVVAGLFAMRAFVWWWDFVRGDEASVIPPEAVVAEPLRRLFVLQFGVLAGGLLVYWVFDSSVAGLAALLVAKTAADVVLAVLERLRAARIAAAVEAGVRPEPRQAPKPHAPRGGRKRRR